MIPEEVTFGERERNRGRTPWRKLAFALLTLAYFLYFNWDGLRAQFAADDMMNMSLYWRLTPVRMLLDPLMPWRGAFRPMGSFFYLPLLQFFGLNPLPYHAVMIAILLGNLYLVYRFARRVGCGELQAGLATLIVAYHAGLSMLYYSTAFIYDVLCFSFYMSAFLYYARIRSQRRLLRGGETALVMFLYLCALNSKEMALTLPLVLLAYELLYHRPAAPTPGEAARWLLGPGRVMLYGVALNVVFLYGKAFGPDAHAASAGLPRGVIAAPALCVRASGDGRSVPGMGNLQFARRRGPLDCACVPGVAAAAHRAPLLLGVSGAHAVAAGGPRRTRRRLPVHPASRMGDVRGDRPGRRCRSNRAFSG